HRMRHCVPHAALPISYVVGGRTVGAFGHPMRDPRIHLLPALGELALVDGPRLVSSEAAVALIQSRRLRQQVERSDLNLVTETNQDRKSTRLNSSHVKK